MASLWSKGINLLGSIYSDGLASNIVVLITILNYPNKLLTIVFEANPLYFARSSIANIALFEVVRNLGRKTLLFTTLLAYTIFSFIVWHYILGLPLVSSVNLLITITLFVLSSCLAITLKSRFHKAFYNGNLLSTTKIISILVSYIILSFMPQTSIFLWICVLLYALLPLTISNYQSNENII